MLVPLYGFVPGDTLGVLVLVDSDETVAELAATLAEAASVRIEASAPLGIRHNEVELDLEVSVANAGLGALDRVDLTAGGRET
jgi:Toluene-4-monooxygenase system protein B (TmoB)